MPITVTLPEPEFFYTLDQVAYLLSVEERWLRQRTFFYGRNPKRKRLDDLEAINIARQDEDPTWRISHRELTRWLIRHGYKIKKRR